MVKQNYSSHTSPFKADTEQKFKMTTKNYTISGLQYSVNNGKWENVVADKEVTFGGTNSNLRLRGTNINGTASNLDKYSTIKFTDKNVKVACTGDIRTLLDWRNYSTVDTQNARFCSLFNGCSVLTSAPELPATKLANDCYNSMFEGCTSLTDAPELKATTLAAYCYFAMFYNCTKLSTVTMLAPSDQISKTTFCCLNWLYNAGTDETVKSRTLKVMDEAACIELESNTKYLPDNWKKGTAGTTVLYENNGK